MKTKLALTAFAAAIAVFSQGAFAQASSPTRAEVKAEAKAANKASRASHGQGRRRPAPKASDTTRAARKATTQAEAKSGQLSATGDAMTKEGKGAPPKTSDTTKAARKAETNAEIKAGKIQPTGDAMTKEGGKQKP